MALDYDRLITEHHTSPNHGPENEAQQRMSRLQYGVLMMAGDLGLTELELAATLAQMLGRSTDRQRYYETNPVS